MGFISGVSSAAVSSFNFIAKNHPKTAMGLSGTTFIALALLKWTNVPSSANIGMDDGSIMDSSKHTILDRCTEYAQKVPVLPEGILTISALIFGFNAYAWYRS